MTLSQDLQILRDDFFHPVGQQRAACLEQEIRKDIEADHKLAALQDAINQLSPAELVGNYSSGRFADVFSTACALLAMHRFQAQPQQLLVRGAFTKYQDLRGSGVNAFLIGDTYIAVNFKGSDYLYYLYSYDVSGVRAVEKMKVHAREGSYLAATANKKNFHDNSFHLVRSKTPLLIR